MIKCVFFCILFLLRCPHRAMLQTRMNPYHVMTAALLVTLGVILQLSSTEACSCLPEHAQTAYCDAEYGKFYDG